MGFYDNLYFVFCVFDILWKIAIGSPLYVSNGTAIIKVDIKSQRREVIIYKPYGRIVGLAADIEDEILFWSDVSDQQHGIYRSYLNGTEQQHIIQDVEECNGLSVDWTSNHVYWTDARKQTVSLANYDGSGHLVLISLGRGHEPRGIIVDSILGLIFWADQGTGQIERARLNGQDRRVIVNNGIYWPNQLAISRVFRKLYWIEASPSSGIMSCDFDGNFYKKERKLFDITNGNPSFGLVVIGNKAILSTWFNNILYSTLVETPYPAWRKEVANLGTAELFSLVSLEKFLQPHKSHPCGLESNGNCSHLCLPTGWDQEYFCACPSFQGLSLGPDNHTCQEPEKMIFYTFQNSGEIGFISTSAIPQLNLVSLSPEPLNVVYDATIKTVIWVDSHNRIYKLKMGKFHKELVLNSSNAIGNISAITYDPINKLLYFVNSGASDVFKDGTIYTWNRIEVLNLVTGFRKSIISLKNAPIDITVDAYYRFLYILTSGHPSAMLRYQLDGTDPHTVYTFQSSPSHLAVLVDGVIVVDHDDLGTSKILILENSTTTMTTTTTEVYHSTGKILDIAVMDSTTYLVEELSGQKYLNILEAGFHHRQWISWPGAYIFSAVTSHNNKISACSSSVCSDQCVDMPDGQQSLSCLCPDNTFLMISSDQHNCSRPENFLIFADLNTIKVINLDDETDNQVQILHQGSREDNIVSVAYDEVNMLYWISQSKIHSKDLTTMKTVIVHQSHQFLEELYLNMMTQMLYWTEWNNTMTGAVMCMDLANLSYSVVFYTHNIPRSIAIDQDQRYLFWTEVEFVSEKYRGTVHKARVDGSNQQKFTRIDLLWPNSLEIYDGQLYVADSSYRVFQIDMHGNSVEALPHKFHSVYDVKFLDDLMFYTDIKSQSLNMFTMVTYREVSLAGNLTRPTSIAIRHPKSLKDSGNCKHNDCSDICIPVPKSYQCACQHGLQLTDGHSQCYQDPWIVTNNKKCKQTCTANADCVTKASSFLYQCMCRPGYYRNNADCIECPEDTYQALYSNNHSCTKCPKGSPNNRTGASSCGCLLTQVDTLGHPCYNKDISKKIKGNSEVSTKPGTVITETSTEEVMLREPSYKKEEMPYFKECPKGETRVLYMPEFRKKIKLPITWVAVDYKGTELNLSSNFPIRRGEINLGWISNDDSGKQTVILQAQDKWGRKVSCEFDVLVLDMEPPSFTYCPHDILFPSAESEERIFWSNPEAEDNIDVKSVSGSHKSGSIFPQGTSEVSYKAVDLAGNEGYCNFTITVSKDEKKICKLPDLKNGMFTCDHLLGSTDEACTIVCQNGYVRSPLALFSKKFSCGNQELLDKLQQVLMTQKPCLTLKLPSKATREYILFFKGPCDEKDLDLREELTSVIVEYLISKNICPVTKCAYSNVTIHCPQPNTEPVKPGSDSQPFTVKWNVTIDNSTGFTDEYIQAILNNMKLELLQFIPNLELLISNKMFTAVSRVETSDLIWGCQPGEMRTEEGCVSCPRGTSHNSEFGTCQLCPVGTYQQYRGQTECTPCGHDKTSDTGSLSEEECVNVSHLDEMSQFLIISACSFGFVFLFLTIILYLQFKRQQKRQAFRNTPRLQSPTMFTAAPTKSQSTLPRKLTASPKTSRKNSPMNSPRLTRSPKVPVKSDILRMPGMDVESETLFSRRFNIYKNHDYEDIADQRMIDSTRTEFSGRTVYQNDFTNSPSGSMSSLGPRSYLGSRSPLASPISDRGFYTGDFRNFSPTLRTNSLRSQKEKKLLLYDK